MTTTTNPYQSPVSAGASYEAPVRLEHALFRVAIALSSAFAITVLGARGTLLELLNRLYVDLPTLTELILSPAFAMVVVVLPAMPLMAHHMSSSNSLRLTWHTFAIALVLAMAALCAIALYLPTVQIGERLN